MQSIAAVAARHRMYVAFGMMRLEGKVQYNSAVLIARNGSVLGTYDKVRARMLGRLPNVAHVPFTWQMFPVYPDAALEGETGVTPGGKGVAAYDLDFGRVSIAIWWSTP